MKRVSEALKNVGMEEQKKASPHHLSGGQKQRVAIAGILAMKPKCIVLDEATSMLDPIGRKEVLKVLKELNQKENITIIHITHYMEEAVLAKRFW
ncbi:ATPase component of general energizing module of ECF transporters [Acetivibrio straminisolvens JCM 21531]|uniref:ATPase component of general energizing module of ECF transporters n=1 Tax=Acetivibrio straminisolvens JCM 21531 TaxID=1294263 RepID=W4VA02_9FIRM|nr:ATPase component of general energizing module of ECF transporters [Acetivibrio straminisolvens JCM 21531]